MLVHEGMCRVWATLEVKRNTCCPPNTLRCSSAREVKTNWDLPDETLDALAIQINYVRLFWRDAFENYENVYSNLHGWCGFKTSSIIVPHISQRLLDRSLSLDRWITKLALQISALCKHCQRVSAKFVYRATRPWQYREHFPVWRLWKSSLKSSLKRRPWIVNTLLIVSTWYYRDSKVLQNASGYPMTSLLWTSPYRDLGMIRGGIWLRSSKWNLLNTRWY